MFGFQNFLSTRGVLRSLRRPRFFIAICETSLFGYLLVMNPFGVAAINAIHEGVVKALTTDFAVSIQNSAYNPTPVTLAVGDSVTWTNRDGGLTHTVTSNTPGQFDSGALGAKAEFSQTFTTAGTFNYHCQIHPSMQGTVHVNQAAQRFRTADFDGDGKTDFGVFRPSNGTWFVLKSLTGTSEQFQFGQNGDVPLDADFDGDRKTDFAVWRASTGITYIVLSTASFLGVQWGGAGDIPSHADLNNDGKTDFMIFRPSSGTWFTLLNGTSTTEQLQFGVNGDIPVRGDIDGDQNADIILWRPTTGEWFFRRSSNGTFGGLQWGGNNDRPVPGDYDGDARTDFGVWRSTDGINYIVRNSGGFLGVQWGAAGDIPVTASPQP